MKTENEVPSKNPSKHSLDGEIIPLHKGVAIYKTHASPYWFARIRDPKTKKQIVRSTKEASRITAGTVAEELARDILVREKAAPKKFTFKYFATRFVAKGRRLVKTGDRNANYIRTTRLFLDNDDTGGL